MQIDTVRNNFGGVCGIVSNLTPRNPKRTMKSQLHQARCQTKSECCHWHVISLYRSWVAHGLGTSHGTSTYKRCCNGAVTYHLQQCFAISKAQQPPNQNYKLPSNSQKHVWKTSPYAVVLTNTLQPSEPGVFIGAHIKRELAIEA